MLKYQKTRLCIGNLSLSQPVKLTFFVELFSVAQEKEIITNTLIVSFHVVVPMYSVKIKWLLIIHKQRTVFICKFPTECSH
jgi:hypothetical protein